MTTIIYQYWNSWPTGLLKAAEELMWPSDPPRHHHPSLAIRGSSLACLDSLVLASPTSDRRLTSSSDHPSRGTIVSGQVRSGQVRPGPNAALPYSYSGRGQVTLRILRTVLACCDCRCPKTPSPLPSPGTGCPSPPSSTSYCTQESHSVRGGPNTYQIKRAWTLRSTLPRSGH